MRAHVSETLLQVDYALDVMWLERRLVSHNVLVSYGEVLLELVVEGLPTDLNTDS